MQVSFDEEMEGHRNRKFCARKQIQIKVFEQVEHFFHSFHLPLNYAALIFQCIFNSIQGTVVLEDKSILFILSAFREMRYTGIYKDTHTHTYSCMCLCMCV